jgi:GTP cyclohydrolase II
MSRPLIVKPLSVSLPPDALVAVDRVVAELRRGAIVVVQGASGAALVLAAEAASPEALARLADLSGAAPLVAISGRRAAVLGLAQTEGKVVLIAAESGLAVEQVQALADPLDDNGPAASVAAHADEPPDWAEAAVDLAKLARLLPAAVVAPAINSPGSELFAISVAQVLSYRQLAAQTLRRVAEARVPLQDAENASIVAFRPADGGIEHLAIVIGSPDGDAPVLTRLHSECFTGDLLGSLRCDCGDQLRGAIAEINQAGGGVLLYLAQEGRGIGLVNKLRAYRLQDAGFDTLDANQQLGFDDDERIYLPAAEMLRQLGIGQVRLLTNNPAKVEGLARHGIAVAERVPHVFPANGHNEQYLLTKATRGGHLF